VTAILDQHDPGVPQTHVLVIGVNSYKHLRGGSGQLCKEYNMNLKQLTSPCVSARAFAIWALKDFENELAPLGSVELLLSEGAPTQFALYEENEPKEVESATLHNIRTAFQSWFQRCDSNEENVAIFYFCGHGVMIQGDSVLLVEDFGADKLEPFSTAINIDRLYRGMAQSKAKVQCYFIDACSNVPHEGLKLEDSGAQSFITPKLTYPHRSTSLYLKASAPGDSAYADSAGKVSRFTSALIEGLKGSGFRRENGKWVVFTTSLMEAVSQSLEHMNSFLGEPLQIFSAPYIVGRAGLLIQERPPTVCISLRLEPRKALSCAQMKLKYARNTGLELWFPQPGGEKTKYTWEVNVEVGARYELSAEFNPPSYKNFTESLVVYPGGGYTPDPILVEVTP
jgi:hypothetical protein